MKHVVIGRGNLGLDLTEVLTESGHSVRLLSTSLGFDFKKLDANFFADTDYVWIAAGFGSVESTKKDFMGAVDTHVNMPIQIAKLLPELCRMICFSSDYAADEKNPWSPGGTDMNPKSLYAVTKVAMELALRALGRKHTFAVRIGSLYGKHFPSKTFPGRLLERYPNPTKLTLPMNRTTPTPTRWIAYVLSRNLVKFVGDFRVFHCAPQGMVSVKEWGRIILGDAYTIETHGFDQSRPLCSNLQCSFEDAPDWMELWRLHWFQQDYHAQRSIEPAAQV